MGTWASPDTTDKAEKLNTLMANPINKSQAEKNLFNLIGNDAFFDAIMHCEETTDIRYRVLWTLQQWLKNLGSFFKPWDKEAIAICQNIIDTYEDKV